MLCYFIAISLPMPHTDNFFLIVLLILGEFSQGIPVNLSDDSPIGYLLPSSKGIGRAALLMIRLLVDAHNSMVLKRKEVQGDQTEYVTNLH